MSLSTHGNVLEVLLVEDDPGDVAMTREALEEHGPPLNLHVVGNGEEALAFLRQQPPFAQSPRPALVILDLNLPRMSGQEVLAVAKADPSLLTIPIVVLTTSTSDRDVARSYELHANAYVAKPVGFEPFVVAVQQIDRFFFSTAELPPPKP
jgi:two-component system response regulator